MTYEIIDNAKEAWITCPSCLRWFNVERLFWLPQWEKLKLHCPFCQTWFAKEESPKIWGAAARGG